MMVVRMITGLPWPVLAAGATVLAVLLWITARAARRTVTLARIRAGAVFAVGSAGMAAAAFGTVRSLIAWGQPLPLALATSATIEGGAIAFAADLYLRSRNGQPAGRPRAFSWAFALASAYANAAHPPSSTTGAGVVIFGLLPLLGLCLIEYQAHTTRTVRIREAAAWPIRVARAAWRRAWTQAATAIGVDVDATDTAIERELAARRAAYATYRLRLAQLAYDAKPSRRAARVLRRRTRTAQAARSRAGVAADPAQAIRLAQHMRELVHGPEHAAGDWSNVAAAASRVYGGLILTGGADGPYNLAVHARTAHADGPDADTRTPSSPVRTRRTAITAVPDADGLSRTDSRTDSRPDVAALVPVAERVIAALVEAGEPVTRDRMAAEIRASGQSLSAARAHALWQQVRPAAA